MKTHIVSFRIGEVENAVARRNSLVRTAHHLSKVAVWEETSSLILIKSNQSAHQIASDLFMLSVMRHDLDTLLVIDLETKRYSTQGKVDAPVVLGSFFAGMGSNSDA